MQGATKTCIMRILLLGEYSNVHNALAQGLRQLGHQVTVASNGDFWKDYPRDIDLKRTTGLQGKIGFAIRFLRSLPKLRGYDVVQLINPLFVELKAERLFALYRYLRKHNKCVFLCAFGMDHFWVNECRTRMPLRYSDFNLGNQLRHNADALRETADWIGTTKEQLNKLIANDCDAIIAGLYEYWVCYQPLFPDKTVFIPFPIKMPNPPTDLTPIGTKVKIFIGINKSRHAYKGTDVMLAAAMKLVEKYPNKVELVKAESVPFDEYQRLMDGCDLILDQLYSYTPSMNPLLAMSKGIICVGGGEPEAYELLQEQHLHPIINVLPNEEDVFRQLELAITNKEGLMKRKVQSVLYVDKHHEYIKVARQYEALYKAHLPAESSPQ